MKITGLKFQDPKITPLPSDVKGKLGNGFNYGNSTYITNNNLPIKESAFYRFWPTQSVVLMFLAFFLSVGIITSWHATLVFILSSITVLYFINLFFDLFLIIRGISKSPEIKISDAELKSIKEEDLPTYTILCPLYKEWQVLPQFVTAIKNLDYPKDKLQVMLLLEEDDIETISRVQTYGLPSYFNTLIVPNSQPKTKPKACNFGLVRAWGDYAVIYDAEDIPEPSQLKKVVQAFERVKTDVGCIQAKLNFYNPHQNVITRLFTSEYSLWFDLILPGLQSINAPIPLGGTSNHFKTKLLKNFQGWDPFNVTEDCDLGIRLAKYGFKTAIVESTTQEEANSDLKNWFFQRTRWIKGYIQTYFVHLRSPNKLMQGLNPVHVFTFQLIVGGKIFCMIVNPLMWLITISYFTFRTTAGPFIESFFPGPILYIGVFSAIFGNFLYLYYYMIGCARKGMFNLIKFAYLVPVYWIVMSLASWVAMFKFIQQPHYWFKTTHGLHLDKKEQEEPSPTNVKPLPQGAFVFPRG